ncbi:hypothetical protein TcWFU_006084 [Taenia crassiceps]|uniref:DUF5727 domain-containing protein n=1 Tax=Taenia crassiceps TaxID=6207 RepID=A0ABR4QRI2_9CEST
MLRAIAVITLVICFSDADPLLWGSRVIGTPEGPSPSMFFRFPKNSTMGVSFNNGTTSKIKVRKGNCYLAKRIWGHPCQMNEQSASITLNDVLKQKMLFIDTESYGFSSTFFVPNCIFPKPLKGGVDLETSFPLSRFGKEEAYVELRFGVQGARRNSWVVLLLNGDFACVWKGIDLRISEWTSCRELTRDTESNLRIFAVNVSKTGEAEWDIFGWYAKKTSLIVTVDWMQGGESPEIEDCKKHQKVPSEH